MIILRKRSLLYAVVDIETTGGHASSNGITEIAICLHNGEKVFKKFHTLINPGYPIPLYIQSLTGITDDMVSSAPVFEDIADMIHEWLKGRVFVAHNVNFDYSFVKHYLKKSGFDLNVKKLCTVRLSRKVFQGLPSYSLGKLCRSLDIPLTNRHRAMGDAAATARLLSKIIANDQQGVLTDMLKKSSGEHWLPLYLEKKDIDALPSTPGVYYFHDTRGKVIYVGKAVNVRKRVISHFSNNDPDRKRQLMIRQVRKVTCQECASELHALILESAEIKKLWPAFNRSHKKPQSQYALYVFEDQKGYLRLAIDFKKKNLPSLYTFFQWQEGQAMLRKLSEAFGIHYGSCLAGHSEEVDMISDSPAVHNDKVHRAIEELKKQLPTFAVMDTNFNKESRLFLLVERGMFRGMGYVSASAVSTKLEDYLPFLEPCADNDFIRSSIYGFVEQYPSSRLNLKT